MRLVSFDRRYDVPYELTMLYSYGRMVMAKCNGDPTVYAFGDYDSREDAEFAMRLARVGSVLMWPVCAMPTAEDAKTWREDFEKNALPLETLTNFIIRKEKDAKGNQCRQDGKRDQ